MSRFTSLTPDMETHLLYMMTTVKMIHNVQRRYQTWFIQRHLTRAESGSLLPDLIRYICGVYHPPNHVIASNVVPR